MQDCVSSSRSWRGNVLALPGQVTEHHGFLFRMPVSRLDWLEGLIDQLGARIEAAERLTIPFAADHTEWFGDGSETSPLPEDPRLSDGSRLRSAITAGAARDSRA